MTGQRTHTDKRVLIVDEDRVRAGLVALHLRRGGLVAIVAESAQAATDALAWGAPDVLLVALGGRSLDGLGLVRAAAGTSTVAFFTASEAPAPDVEFEAARLGVQGFMIHPLDPAATLARVDRAEPRVLGVGGSQDEIVDDLSRRPLDTIWDLCWRCAPDARVEVGDGAVVIREGQPIDAWSGALTGRDAFFALATLDTGPVKLVRLLTGDPDRAREDVIGLDLATALSMAHTEDPPTRRDARHPTLEQSPDTRMSGPPGAMSFSWPPADAEAAAEGPATLPEGPPTLAGGPPLHLEMSPAPEPEPEPELAPEPEPFGDLPQDLVSMPDELVSVDTLPGDDLLEGLDDELPMPGDLGADDTYEGTFEATTDVEALVESMTGDGDAASWLPAGDWQDALGGDDLIAEALQAASDEVSVVAPAEQHGSPTTSGGLDEQLDLGDWDLESDVLVDPVASPEPVAAHHESAEEETADLLSESKDGDDEEGPSTRDLIAATLPGFGRGMWFKRGAVAALAAIFVGLGGFVAYKLMSGPAEAAPADGLVSDAADAEAEGGEAAGEAAAEAPPEEPHKTPVPSLEDEVREAYGKGVIAIRDGDRETAARHFRHVLRRMGGHDGAMAGLAAALVDGDTIEEARVMLNVLSRSRPNDAAVQLQLALVAHKQDDIDAARAALDRFLALAPQDPQAGDARRLIAALEPDAHR